MMTTPAEINSAGQRIIVLNASHQLFGSSSNNEKAPSRIIPTPI